MNHTVGEVIEGQFGIRWRIVEVNENGVVFEAANGSGYRWRATGVECIEKIVEVAPENRANVTAGPSWMKGTK